MYVEDGGRHPDLRIRRNGDHYELTRKRPVDEGDASRQTEITIVISEKEFESLSSAQVRKVEKTRYYYTHKNVTAEFDVFEVDLAGLVLVDVEFATESERDAFTTPDFCLVDVTQEGFVAGGMLAGKSYIDIESDLERFDYHKLSI